MSPNPNTWSTRATDPVSVANNRVCRALLRIYRSVPLSISEIDNADTTRPFWPFIRQEARLLRQALATIDWSQPSQSIAGRRRMKLSEDVPAPGWLAALMDRSASIPESMPDPELLGILGEALASDRPAFRPLFDAVEARIEKRVRAALALTPAGPGGQ